MTSQAEAALLLPDDWWVVPLTGGAARRASLKALVERQLGHADVDARLRADLRRELDAVTSAAAQQGGRFYAVCLMQVDGRPMSTFTRP